jgi:predicted permease
MLRLRRGEQEFSAEIEEHLALAADEFVRRGMSPQEARLAARRSFGGVTQIQDAHREARGIMHLHRLYADVKYALRMMRLNPGFTLLAVLTLGMGIGVNTTLFTAYNAVVLKPLPIADPDAVYRMERWFQSRNLGNIQYAFSYPEYAYLRDHNRGFESLVAASWPVRAFAEWPGTGGSETSGSGKVDVQLVSANYFAALGIRAERGRGFAQDEDRAPGASPVVVLSHSYWKRLNAGPLAIGQIVKLNGTAFTVVGVAPEAFTGTAQSASVPDFWAPLSMQAQLAPGSDWLRNIERDSFQILGRVRPGIRFQNAQAEAALLIAQIGATHRERDKTVSLTLEHTAFLDNTDDWRFQALVAGVMLLVGTVLLVACANLANMMLARGAARQKEIGVRLALGANRMRVIRQLLTESVALGLFGGLTGLALAVWGSRLLWLNIEQMLPGHYATLGGFKLAIDMSPDLRVLGYALLLSIVTGVLFGLSPALQFTRPDLTTALKDEGSALGRRLSRSRLRSVLIAAQVTVSMMLLITAGLLTRGLTRSRVADAGFDTRTLYFLTGDYGDDGRDSGLQAIARQRRLLERIASLPQVSRVTEGGMPLSGTWTPPMVADRITGRTLASFGSESYLETVGIPLLRGRNFTPAEVRRNAPVAVISEATARRFWPHTDPIGHRFQLDMDFRGTMSDFEVIGVARDVRFANLSRVDPAHVYLTTKAGDFPAALVRIHGDPRTALAAIRGTVQAADPDLMPSLILMSMDDGPVWLQKLQAETMALGTGILAGLALLLAGTGIYGVMAYLVGQRTREIGIRMALGASARDVMRGVVMSGLRPVFAGIVCGIAGAAGLSAILHSTLVFPGSADFLYGVSFYDPASFVGLAAFVIVVAALASAVPARRAVRVDPVVALRYE